MSSVCSCTCSRRPSGSAGSSSWPRSYPHFEPPASPPVVPSFWSDQYDRSMQYAGEHDGDCDLVVRGDLSQPDAPLVAFFLRAGTLTAVLTVNSGKELRRAQRLIGHPVDPAALADPDVDLRQLPTLAAAAHRPGQPN